MRAALDAPTPPPLDRLPASRDTGSRGAESWETGSRMAGAEEAVDSAREDGGALDAESRDSSRRFTRSAGSGSSAEKASRTSAISAAASGEGARRVSSSPLSRICQLRVSIGIESLVGELPALHALGLADGHIVAGIGRELEPGQPMGEIEEILEDHGRIRAEPILLAHDVQRGAISPAIAASKRSNIRARSARPSMSRTRSSVTSPAPWANACSSSDWASRTEPSAARAIRPKAASSIGHLLFLRDHAQIFDQHRDLDAPQIEPLAARQNGHRNLADFRRREDEADMLRRLFERLEKRVERVLREHVHFVDDVDLLARRTRAHNARRR